MQHEYSENKIKMENGKINLIQIVIHVITDNKFESEICNHNDTTVQLEKTLRALIRLEESKVKINMIQR